MPGVLIMENFDRKPEIGMFSSAMKILKFFKIKKVV
jgi:hypothetical protein